jgi:hypothetical protein
MMLTVHDRSGNTVAIGSRVRVLSLAGRWLDDLSPSERKRVFSMIGDVFEITEVDEYGQAWVQKEWNWRRGVRTHAVGLSSHEMDLVIT